MSDSNPLLTPSANLKKAICWLSDTVKEHAEKTRKQIIREAELRFDLTPLEAEFLEKNFDDAIGNSCE